jgi:hypothetical protein
MFDITRENHGHLFGAGGEYRHFAMPTADS